MDFGFQLNAFMKKQPKYPNRIRELRNAKQPKMTLEALSGLTEISVTYLYRMEAGERPLSTKLMPKIARALGVKPAELIDSSKAI